MRMRWLGAVTIAFIGCARTHAPAPPRAPSGGLRFELEALDKTADPCADFYEYACGTWRKTHPIPADRSRWSRYNELDALNLERERAIVEGGEGRAGAYDAACMDTKTIEARGLAPLAPLLAQIDTAPTAAIAELLARGVATVLDVYVEPDQHDVTRVGITLDRGVLGLHRNEYLEPASAPLREQYKTYLVHVFTALGSAEASAEADRTIAFETMLAQHTLSPVEERDPKSQDHPTTRAELAATYAGIDWTALFARLHVDVHEANVAVPDYVATVSRVLAQRDYTGLRSYLRARVAHAFAPVLPRAIDDAVVDFDQRTVRGVKEAPPRWKRCLSLTDDDIGDEVGRIFLARHFPTATQTRVGEMVAALRGALERRIGAADWLGPDARAAAKAKLANLIVVMGGSQRLRSYDGVEVRADDAFGNAFRVRERNISWDLETLNKPTDRQRFFDELPQSLDGFSAPRYVAVGFTAGFLQPPVFNADLDDPINYGGLGGVIGHELTHEFDDEGRKFDVHGNLATWWSPDDVAHYEARAQCFVDEYEHFHAEEGTPVNGKLTLGENLADNGGLRLSYEALHPSAAGPTRDGFTPLQRFFLAWGQIRCENTTPEAERRQVKTDGHSPGRARVNGVVSNMPEFATAFQCKPGAPMAPEKRCALW